MVCGGALEDAGQRAGFDRIVPGNDFVVLAVAPGGYADAHPLLPDRLTTQDAESLDPSRAIDVARQLHSRAAASYSQYLFTHEMQPDNLRSLGGLVEVAADGVLDHGAQLFQRLPLGMNAVAQSGSRVAAVRLFPQSG